MSEVVQSQFRGLVERALNEKEPQDAARRAINVDLHHQQLEPRPGRDTYASGFAGGGLRLDGDRRWLAMIVGNQFNAPAYQQTAFSICWRYDPDVDDWLDTTSGTLIAAWDRFNEYVKIYLYMNAGTLELRVDFWDGAATRTSSWNWPASADGDVWRINVWFILDTPAPGDTTVYAELFQNGGVAPVGGTLSNAVVGFQPGAWAADTRISLGATGWHDPNTNTDRYFHPCSGTIADFLTWYGSTANLTAQMAATDWYWNVLDQADYTLAPEWHIPCDKITSWTTDQTGADAGTQTWVRPTPVLCGSRLAPVIDRWQFSAGHVGHINMPDDWSSEGNYSAICLDVIVPQGFATNQFMGTIAVGDGWYLDLEDVAGTPTFRLTDWSGASITLATAAAGANARVAVVFDRNTVSSTTWALTLYQYNGAGPWTNVGGLGCPWDPELEFWVGGFPTAGQLTQGYTLISKISIGIIPDNTTAYLDDMMSDYVASPTVAQWVADNDSGFMRFGPDDETMYPLFGGAPQHAVIAAYPRTGHEIRMNMLLDEQPGLAGPIEYLTHLHPPSIRAVTTYERRDGYFRQAVLTETGVHLIDPDSPTSPEPVPATTGMTRYEETHPVVGVGFRERAWFFGSSATRPKFDGDASSRIGLMRPYLREVEDDPITQDGNLTAATDYFIRVSLYNSRTGQESNLSNTRKIATLAGDDTILVSMEVGFREGDDFDQVRVYRKSLNTGEYHLEVTVRRVQYRGRQVVGWLAYQDLSGISLPDTRIPIKMDESVLERQKLEEADNWEAPAALIGEFHADRLFLVPQDIPDVVIFSKQQLVESFPATNFAKVGERAGNPIRALVSTPAGLLVGTRREVYLISRGTEETPNPERISAEAGILSQASVAQYGASYLWVSDRGVEAFDGSGVRLVSENIRERFKALTFADLATAQGAVWSERQQYWLVCGSDLYMLNLLTGEWTEGVLGAKCLADLASARLGRRRFYSGYWGHLYEHEDERREDGQGWANSTLTNNPDYVNTWQTQGGLIVSMDVNSTIDADDLPNVAFFAFSDELIDAPRIVPLAIDRVDGARIFLSEPIDPDGATDGYVYWYVPVLYETHRMAFDGVEFRKRLRCIRLHWDVDSAGTTTDDPELAVLIDNILQAAGWPVAVSRANELYTEVNTRYLCRTWAMRIAMASEDWYGFPFLEWLYDLRRKTG